ncbi:hypothetical protein C1645_742667 [Glomus cerebriforme]|uniref:BTB domain-containing protein n=1 Tax=Glomus cerebriforme TaxID=658196 RepID=A0A397SGH5_9GLOM|nr:hypothetical protein C1645_742667 [Glomus cerebriforme]
MSYKPGSNVIKMLRELLETEANYDVIIHVGKEPNIKEFHAHSNILSCRSEYFNEILFGENIQKQNEKYVINKPNFAPQAYELIIKYLYIGHINITNKTGTELLDIIIASDDLKLKKLTKITENFIIKNHPQFIRNYPIGILQVAYYKSLANLQELCLETICFEPRILFKSDKFIKLPASILEVILKRDDLNLIEIEIWENLIKWGFAQEQGLKRDTSKWNQEDINTFKRILYRFIPLIRFHVISSEDYINKVKPYEGILSKELRDDILKSHMISGYRPTLNIYTPRYSKCNDVDSTIINQEHMVLFANWIDRKEENSKYIKVIPYEFNLLYRASSDGKKASYKFHNKCDNKGATIIILKIENSEQIVGRYDNPLQLDSGKSTNNSFLFTSKDNFQKIGYSNNNCNYKGYYDKYHRQHSRYYDVKNSELEKSDLRLSQSGTWYTYRNNYSPYPDIGIPYTLKVEDYEIFQVIKKTYNQIEKDNKNISSDEILDKTEKVRKRFSLFKK